jgi:hypothetical protein
MEITGSEYRHARSRYYRILGPWTAEYPTFERFLSPANVSMLNSTPSDNAYFTLSITGEKRWAMLHSQHAESLLKAWLVQRG